VRPGLCSRKRSQRSRRHRKRVDGQRSCQSGLSGDIDVFLKTETSSAHKIVIQHRGDGRFQIDPHPKHPYDYLLEPLSFIISPIPTINVTKEHPEDEILAQAKKRNCDLIVMGTRGHGMIEEALLGSTARRVVWRSKKPNSFPSTPTLSFDNSGQNQMMMGADGCWVLIRCAGKSRKVFSQITQRHDLVNHTILGTKQGP